MNGTYALDIECPECGHPPKVKCRDGVICRARIKAAAKKTRDANRAARESAKR